MQPIEMEWIICPICKNKTRLKIREDTEPITYELNTHGRRLFSLQYRRTSSIELLKRYLEERAYDCTDW